MKNIILFTLALIFSLQLQAKKVKFAVDLTGLTISPNGVHVGGDFQVLAGYPADFESNTTVLTQEGTTDLYSIVIDIPAFAKYEYKFINGDQWYEAEFIPQESRVGYNFNDNRWLYVDSLANDTTDIGAVIFAANAPVGKTMIRFYVDMQSESSIHPSGVHVAGTFQGWNPASHTMYYFGFLNGLYETIAFADGGTVEYKFYNGNTSEVVPGPCNVNSNRSIELQYDSLISTACFSSCGACVTGIRDVAVRTIQLYPNPTADYAIMDLGKNQPRVQVIIVDITGKKASEFYTTNPVRIEKNNLKEGVYSVYAITEDQQQFTGRLIIK